MALTVLTAPVKPARGMKRVVHWLGNVEPWMVAGGDWQFTMISLLVAVTDLALVSVTMS